VSAPGRIGFKKAINIPGKKDLAGDNTLLAKILVKMRDV